MKWTLEKLQEKKYGKLIVVEETTPYQRPSGKRNRCVICKCDCGNDIVARIDHLVNNAIISCGCRMVTHGLSYNAIYNVFHGMKNRCYTKSNTSFSDYGGRGISICNQWLNNPQEFFDWALANGYKEGLTIDRINTNGNYEPDNCRFVTTMVNNRNKRNAKLDEQKVKDIRTLAKTTNQVELAKLFNTSRTNVSAVVTRRSWQNVI